MSFSRLVCSVIGFLVVADLANGQLSGSRGGVANAAEKITFVELSPQSAQSYIAVDGKAVLRVKPTQIRVVLALTSEATTSSECKREMEQKLAKLRPLWNELGVGNDRLVEDFISVLPRFEFEVKSVHGQDVASEKKVGYLMQTNVHLAVSDDDEAMKVLEVAFANDVTDIIGFDYWSDELDAKKNEARAQAIQAARDKSDVLLELFEKRPSIINIQEQTVVHYPESMYESFKSSSSAEYRQSYGSRRNLPQILLPRPKNTYYRGFSPNADVQPKDLAMRAELSIVSTVRIYYESPVAKTFNANRDR